MHARCDRSRPGPELSVNLGSIVYSNTPMTLASGSVYSSQTRGRPTGGGMCGVALACWRRPAHGWQQPRKRSQRHRRHINCYSKCALWMWWSCPGRGEGHLPKRLAHRCPQDKPRWICGDKALGAAALWRGLHRVEVQVHGGAVFQRQRGRVVGGRYWSGSTLLRSAGV